jgi:hypothetical protein
MVGERGALAVGAVAEGTRRPWGRNGVNNACRDGVGVLRRAKTRDGVTFLGVTCSSDQIRSINGNSVPRAKTSNARNIPIHCVLTFNIRI